MSSIAFFLGSETQEVLSDKDKYKRQHKCWETEC